jgi:hypothetical protein
MVKDPGKTLHTGAFKPLSQPEFLQVEEDIRGFPLAVRGSSRQRVLYIEDRWSIDDEWWRAAPLARTYFAVMVASGQRQVIFKDMVAKRWCRQSY